MLTFRQQLEIVRQYTGDAFKAKKGYRANMKPNFGQRMAVRKYYNKIAELTAIDTVTYTPKKGEKAEAFAYTGQTGFRKFTKAIIRKISPQQKLKFQVDKSRPKGSRFVVTDTATGRQFVNIPAYVFEPEFYDPEFYDYIAGAFGFADTQEAVDYIGGLTTDESDDLYSEYIFSKYAPEAKFFLINAGESYVWGSGGNRQDIAAKMRKYKETYSATNFDANDKRSSYYGNWLRGVTAFRTRFDIIERIGEAQASRAAYRKKFMMSQDKNYRMMKNGLLGVFVDGQLTESIVPTWERSGGANVKKKKR